MAFLRNTDRFSAPVTEAEVHAMGSLTLAHVGDAVFELMVRLYLLRGGDRSAGDLHRAAVEMVNASAQARDALLLRELLTEEETQVFLRGRNTRVHGVPRNMSVGDYHAATGLEALFGYLYLLGRRDRLSALFDRIVEES
ncbi:MAG: ribonuclease III [Oscillospiraceae bacterium]|nr:ribonuclease III [Oscillospiraceae bacterium]